MGFLTATEFIGDTRVLGGGSEGVLPAIASCVPIQFNDFAREIIMSTEAVVDTISFRNDADRDKLRTDSGLSEQEFDAACKEAYELLEKDGAILNEFKIRAVRGAIRFPYKLDIPLAIASIHLEIQNPEDGKYTAAVKSKILGFTIGEALLTFSDGQLTRTEKIGTESLGGNYTITIRVKDGFAVQLEAHLHVKIFGVRTVDFGPKWIF
ncbi:MULTISPECIES: hypothetical protein [Paraburkholderia]|uniref:hypothetical protein n=1 Tax=Paraburkholderia TaxID=1822464 RepID=UPI0008422EBB|nr:hypothetical protein [Paraburkholderia nodosa]